jgi:hypothetical protein
VGWAVLAGALAVLLYALPRAAHGRPTSFLLAAATWWVVLLWTVVTASRLVGAARTGAGVTRAALLQCALGLALAVAMVWALSS